MSAASDQHLDRAFRLLRDVLEQRTSLDDIERRIAEARAPALRARAEGLLRQLRHAETAAYSSELHDLLNDAAHENGRLIDFERFASLLETELAGIVITAHPTFSLSEAATRVAHDLIGGNGTPDPLEATRSMHIHRRTAPTLQQEQIAANAAIGHIRSALRQLLGIAVDVAEKLYPDRYRQLPIGCSGYFKVHISVVIFYTLDIG